MLTVSVPLKAAACIFFSLFFTVFYNQEWLILQTIYALNKEILPLKSAAYTQEQFQIKSWLYHCAQIHKNGGRTCMLFTTSIKNMY